MNILGYQKQNLELRRGEGGSAVRGGPLWSPVGGGILWLSKLRRGEGGSAVRGGPLWSPVGGGTRQSSHAQKNYPLTTGNLSSRPAHLHLVHLVALLLFLTLLLSSCAFPGMVSTSAQLPPAHPIPHPTPLPAIHFPQDEGAHNDLTEWWYYTGHMIATTPDGKTHHYGFELVIFQALRSDLPPVYAAHFAISDITRGEFHFDQRRLTEPDALKNSASTIGIHVSIGNWTIQGVNGLDHLVASMANYGLHIDLLGQKPPTLHNGNGLITYGLGGFSYYYSRTRMSLSGTLIDHNVPLQVTGEAWMDHQWGNFLPLGGGGWDWFSIQLNNFSEMMLYFIRDASGKVTSTYIGYIAPDAHDYLLPASALKVTVLGHWQSPTTGANYPSGWNLQINDPQIHATIVLTPELKNQELVVYQSTGNSYWEGAVSISGQSQGKPIEGEGYVELTGYAK